MTQTDQIQTYLESGKTLTPLQALNMFGCFRLAARILDLREAGLDIKMKMVLGGEKRYAEYSLDTGKTVRTVQVKTFSETLF